MPVAEIQNSAGLISAEVDQPQSDSARVGDGYAQPSVINRWVVARYALTTLLSIVVSLCCLEAVARIVVWLGRPVNFSGNQFEAKYWDAVHPTPLLVLSALRKA